MGNVPVCNCLVNISKDKEGGNFYLNEEENKKENDDLSNSFSSDMSSQETSLTDSSIKDKEKEDFEFNKVTDFFLQDFNFELDFFSSEN